MLKLIIKNILELSSHCNCLLDRHNKIKPNECNLYKIFTQMYDLINIIGNEKS